MLLKRKNDDWLEWPMNLPYKIEILVSKPHRTTAQGRRSFTTPRQVCTAQLSNLIRVTSVLLCKEIIDINLPERELLNYEMVVNLIPVKVSPQAATAAIPLIRECPICCCIIDIPGEFCYTCGSKL